MANVLKDPHQRCRVEWGGVEGERKRRRKRKEWFFSSILFIVNLADLLEDFRCDGCAAVGETPSLSHSHLQGDKEVLEPSLL